MRVVVLRELTVRDNDNVLESLLTELSTKVKTSFKVE